MVGVLRGKGFDVQMPEFQTRIFESEKPVLTVGGTAVKARDLEYSAATPPEGVSGPLVAAPADETPGCAPADYDGLPVKGAVVLVDRGSCPFSEKQAIAAETGAVAMVVANNVDEEKMGGTLGADTDVKIPVVSVTKADGARLRAKPGPTTLIARCEDHELHRAQRDRADQDRLHRRRGDGRRAPRQRAGRARASTTTAPVSRRCWKPRCNWAVHPM